MVIKNFGVDFAQLFRALLLIFSRKCTGIELDNDHFGTIKYETGANEKCLTTFDNIRPIFGTKAVEIGPFLRAIIHAFSVFKLFGGKSNFCKSK